MVLANIQQVSPYAFGKADIARQVDMSADGRERTNRYSRWGVSMSRRLRSYAITSMWSDYG